METAAAQQLRRARAAGEPEFVTDPTRVEETGLLIPAVHARPDARLWRLQDDWTYEGDGFRLTVPRGWETDLASIPGTLRPWLNDFLLGITGPLAHDFIYDHGGCPPPGSCDPPRRFTRWEADRILLRLMRLERVRRWHRTVSFLFVRAAGRTHWGVRGSRLPDL